MAAQLSTVLQAALSQDAEQRSKALDFLQTSAQTDLPGFMMALSDVLADTTATEPGIRQQAGLQLKNCLISRDDTDTARKLEQWRAQTEPVREHVKQRCLATLGTESGRSTAARVIAGIAEAEIPNGMWPTLMGMLLSGITAASSPDSARVAALEAVGYICESVDYDHVKKDANEILTAVVGCMRQEGASTQMIKAAIDALTNALEFCETNFNTEADRNHIMQVVCETTQNQDEDIQVASLQCLVEIMKLYYRFMAPYIMALFQITMQSMESATESVILQGIEFWSSVAETEEELIELREEAERISDEPPQEVSQQYAQGAQAKLVPIILRLMEQQDEGSDPDEWNVSKAGHVCLKNLSRCVRNEILQYVVPYVSANLQAPTWQQRDAAVQAFGAVLDGPKPEDIKNLAQHALTPLIHLMEDPSPSVRDSVAWVLGSVCDQHSSAITGPPSYVRQVTECLLKGLEMEPLVANNVCWALGPLIEAVYDFAMNTSESSVKQFELSAVEFEIIVSKVLATAERPDATQQNLRAASYEAVMQIMQYVPENCAPTLLKVVDTIIGKLQASLAQTAAVAAHGRDAVVTLAETQSLMCGVLTKCIQNMDSPAMQEEIKQRAPTVMELVLGMFQTATGTEQPVQEDALMCVSAMAETIGADFAVFLEHVKPFILAGIQNVQEYECCIICVGLIGDAARAVAGGILPYCDEYMMVLLQTLGEPNVNQTVKPHILSCFSDIALAIGEHFVKYFDASMESLKHASILAATDVHDQDYDDIDHMNELREGVLEAYIGIVSALKGASPASDTTAISPHFRQIAPHAGHIVGFIEAIIHDSSLSNACLEHCAGLFGDLIGGFKADIQQCVDPGLLMKVARETCALLDRKQRRDPTMKSLGRYKKYLKNVFKPLGVDPTVPGS